MSFTAKQIKGGVVEKIEEAYHAIRSHRSYGHADTVHLDKAERLLKEVIDTKSSIPLEFDREGLAQLAHRIWIESAKCPNCNDIGYWVERTGEEEHEQVQCEFCYTHENSIFKFPDRLVSAIINAPINTVLKVGK